MECEVCKRPANDRTPADYDGVKIDCPDCEKYAIAGSILDRFRRLDPEERKEALRRAKRRTGSGSRPLISTTEL